MTGTQNRSFSRPKAYTKRLKLKNTNETWLDLEKYITVVCDLRRTVCLVSATWCETAAAIYAGTVPHG